MLKCKEQDLFSVSAMKESFLKHTIFSSFNANIAISFPPYSTLCLSFFFYHFSLGGSLWDLSLTAELGQVSLCVLVFVARSEMWVKDPTMWLTACEQVSWISPEFKWKTENCSMEGHDLSSAALRFLNLLLHYKVDKNPESILYVIMQVMDSILNLLS